MKLINFLVGLLCIGIPVAILAQQPSPNTAFNGDAFLSEGEMYHIRLPDDRNPFMHRFSETAQATETTTDGRVIAERSVPITATIRSDIFRVVRMHGECWALVEHPLRPQDYAAWEGKHRSAYLLKEPTKLSSEQSKRVVESANREIKTTRTWLNLNQAITIAPVTEESLRL